MIQVHKSDILYARLRECWVRKDNLRISCDFEGGWGWEFDSGVMDFYRYIAH